MAEYQFKDKVVVITGASAGIGRVTVWNTPRQVFNFMLTTSPIKLTAPDKAPVTRIKYYKDEAQPV